MANDLAVQVDDIRATLIDQLTKLVQPHLRGSGYVNDNTVPEAHPNRYVQLCSFGMDDGEPTQFEHEQSGLFILGFVDDGVLDDAYGGGLCITGYDAMSVEQLMFALETVIKHGSELQ